MVGADQRLQIAQRSRRCILWPDFPHNASRLLRDDKHHGATIISDDIVWVKALVTSVIPLVRANIRRRVEKHAVLTPTPVHHCLLRRFAVSELLEMLSRHPLPTDMAAPVHLDDAGRPREIILGDMRPSTAFLAQNQGLGLTALGGEFGDVVTHRTALADIVVVLSS